jgi:hypothetical protein
MKGQFPLSRFQIRFRDPAGGIRSPVTLSIAKNRFRISGANAYCRRRICQSRLVFLSWQKCRETMVKQEMSSGIAHRTRGITVLLVIFWASIVITPRSIFPIRVARGITSRFLTDGMSGGRSTSMGTGSIKKYAYAARAEVAVGLLVIRTWIALFLREAHTYRKIPGSVGIGPGGITIPIPAVLTGVCSSPDSPGRIGTRPALFLPDVLAVITGVLLVPTRPET